MFQKKVKGDICESESRRTLETVLDLMVSGLRKSRCLAIDDFGTFTLHITTERVGVNPHSGARVRVAARCSVVFEAAQPFIDYLDS